MIFRRARLAGAVGRFEAAVRTQDPQATEDALGRLHQRAACASRTELTAAAVRLAGLLPEVPTAPRARVALLIGACVELGADPVACAPGLLAGVRQTLGVAVHFPERWRAAGGGELPLPDEGTPHGGVAARVGEEVADAWWALLRWETAAVAVLNHRAVREAVGDRRELLATTARIAATVEGLLTCLNYALLVLDDEPLVVLHRATRTGYRLRMTGVADNFQLHTLLAAELSGAGHVPGEVPSAEAVAVCRNVPGQAPTAGTFRLSAPDGGEIWNEGTPAEIPEVDGVRLLVLDPLPYARSWPAGRFFANMPGDLVLERVLSAEETARWFDRVVALDGAGPGRPPPGNGWAGETVV
ncbi:hypothetical protein ACSMX9_00945 [Streptomyces sp. LE64]|uniref:hypothetical protein n=1 Tax=Streptomyces sp. LE64 TaxID=3448653 RepID=UPI00404287CB